MTLAPYREVKQFEPSANTAPAWLAAFRKNAYESIQKNGFPSRKQEGWKYLNLEPILSNVFAENTKAEELNLNDMLLEDAYQVVVQNGKINTTLSSSDLPQNLVVCSFEDALKNYERELETCINLSQAETLNSFEALNRVHFQDGLFCLIQKETKLEKPLQILIANSSAETDAVFYPRLYVVANEGSKANILFTQVGKSNAKTLCNLATYLFAKENSCLELVSYQDETEKNYSLANNFVFQAAGSAVNWTTYTHSCNVIRNETKVAFTGKSASTNINSLCLLSGENEVYNHVTVEHRVGACTSQQLSKHILNGKARNEFNSMSHIFEGASLSDSQQMSRSMLLSDKARIFSRPQLRVYNEDVKAAHGATIGQVSADELFYLQSRGIAKDEATSLLVYGFAEEVVETIADKTMRAFIEKHVQRDLREVVSTEV